MPTPSPENPVITQDHHSKTESNYFESFIFQKTTPPRQNFPAAVKHSLIEISEDDTDHIQLQKLCQILNCKPFETKYFDMKTHGNELLRFLVDYNKAISPFGYNLDLSDFASLSNETNGLNNYKEVNCDQLELEMEKLYPKYVEMMQSLNRNIQEMNREICRLKNKVEIKYFDKFNKAYLDLKNKRYNENLINTRAYQNFKNRKIVRVLEEGILVRNTDTDVKKALKEIVARRNISVSDLEALLEVGKLDVLKVIFELQNKGFVKFDKDTEICSLWHSE